MEICLFICSIWVCWSAILASVCSISILLCNEKCNKHFVRKLPTMNLLRIQLKWILYECNSIYVYFNCFSIFSLHIYLLMILTWKNFADSHDTKKKLYQINQCGKFISKTCSRAFTTSFIFICFIIWNVYLSIFPYQCCRFT